MDEKMKKKLLEALKAKGYSDEDAEAFINELTSEDESVKDDVEKAEEEIEEKGDDEQTEEDRVDESVGEQLKGEDKEDSQSAKDRVDESEGEEKADEAEKSAKEEVPAEEPKQEAEHPSEESKSVTRDEFIALLGKLDKLITLMSKGADKDAEALENAKARYGVNPGVFQNDGEEEGEKITDVRKAKAVFRTH